jgi:hypothetical protein
VQIQSLAQAGQSPLSRALISLALAHDLLKGAASRALIDVPSSAANIRISCKRVASSLSVMLVFI